MSQKQIKRARRASKRVQEQFVAAGLTQREYIARVALSSALFQMEFRAALKGQHFSEFTSQELSGIATKLLLERTTVDLTGLQVNIAMNPATGGLVFQVDATDEARRNMLHRAECQLSAVG